MNKLKIFQLSAHVWLAGFVNVGSLIAQLWQLYITQNSAGLSLIMCFGFLYIQFTYGRLGQTQGNKALMWCMYISFVVQSMVIIYVIILRHLLF